MAGADLIARIAQTTQGAAGITETEAHAVFSAVLDDGVGELELGALLALWEVAPLELPQLLGFYSAMAGRAFKLKRPPGEAKPIVFATTSGSNEETNLLPLLALALRRLNVPVLIHGSLDGSRATSSAHIFRELGVMPCATLMQTQQQLDQHKLAFVPTALLAPAIGRLLALRPRLGCDRIAGLMSRLLQPFDTDALRVMSAPQNSDRAVVEDFLDVTGDATLVLDGGGEEPFASASRRPEIRLMSGGCSEVLFNAEGPMLRRLSSVPEHPDVAVTAAWTRRVLAGETPMPMPLVNQVACCLYGAGYTSDMNQAKAIAAVQTGSLIAA